MKIVFAFDSFKGSLSAADACEAAAGALRSAGHACILRPLADGGEGTADALVRAMGGELVHTGVTGPLPGMQIEAAYGWCPAHGTAVVEMAAASGLTLLEEEKRNPLLTTTRGTGELILHAARRKPARILLGVGGSATVDGGTGAARALGWRFLDRDGHDIPEGGGGLDSIDRVIPPDNPDLPPVDVLCDVTNPLTGPNGAAAVFGPQKGAGPDMVRQLDRGLARLAAVVRSGLGVDIGELPGGGAAGGLAAGAVAFMNGTLVSGIDRILDALDFEHASAGADWIVTGEGSFDAQSLQGKVVSGVMARIARMSPRPKIAVLAGRLGLTPEQAREAGIDYVDSVTPGGMPFAEARRNAPALLAEAARRFAASA